MKVRARSCAWGIIALGCACLSLKAQVLPIIPPTVSRVTPPGVMRGSTVTLTLEGRNLAGAETVLFDAPGLVGRILGVRDLPQAATARDSVEAPVALGPRQEAKLELTTAPDVEVALHQFRLQTPLGTSNLAVLDVGALPEIQETEPNDSLADSQPIELPCTVVGTLAWPGDVDSFQFNGHAGQELVFQVIASSLSSELQSVLVLRDGTGQVLARAGDFSRQPDAVLTFKLPADGKYTLSVSDWEQGGGPNHFYRLNAGAFPYLAKLFPLGVRAGQSADVDVKGSNLGQVHKVKMQAPASTEGWQTLPVRVKTSQVESLNKLYLAVGNEPEVMESEPNNSPAEAEPITIPATINGHISGSKRDGSPDEDYFRFRAKKGQRLTIEVAAARLGSPLDSVVEVLDAKGSEIPQATIRSLVETYLNLVDRDSKSPSFRLVSLAGLRANDYLMVGDELVQIIFVPDQGQTVTVKSYRGERIPLLNTSPQAHFMGTPAYKVQILKPGSEFPPNGLPVFHLAMRNDDGGPGYGQDSRLDFTAPQDSEYLLRIKDVRGRQGEDFAYRLTVRDASPDFTLSAEPANPNVPRGGRVPIRVRANRTLGYQGPIEVQVKGLPQGMTATAATIASGQDSTVVILVAAADASPSSTPATPFQIMGQANLGGRELVRVADAGQPLRVVSIIPPPDLLMAAEPQEVILEPGKTTTVTLHVERKNGFRGRVPCDIENLPPGVSVENVGLNGVLVPENETTRTVTLRAEEWVRPVEQHIYVVGTVESNSPTNHASAPLKLRIPAKEMVSGDTAQAATNP